MLTPSQTPPCAKFRRGASYQAGPPPASGQRAARGKCRSLNDLCVLGKKLILTLSPGKKKTERKLAKKLKKKGTPKLRAAVSLTDMAGNTVVDPFKLKLKRERKG